MQGDKVIVCACVMFHRDVPFLIPFNFICNFLSEMVQGDSYNPQKT